LAVQDIDRMLWPAVQATIASLGIDTKDGTADAAAAKLAQQYARTIDEAPPGRDYYTRLRWLGPELLKVLEQLGATPAARAAIKRGQAADKPAAQVSKLEQLREARSKRA
jgi:hypothetical protein